MQNKRSKAIVVVLSFVLLVACGSQPKKKSAPLKPLPTKATVAPVLTPELDSAYQSALNQLKQGSLSQAGNAFRQLLIQEPRLAGAHVNLGLIALKSEDNAKANKHFNDALQLNPKNTSALLHLALEELRAGRFWDAEAKLLRVVELAPNHQEAHFNLGVLYELYLQDFDKAADHYEAYVGLTSNKDKAVVERWIKLLD